MADCATKRASGRPKSWVHFIAGGVGGMCGAIVTSPLDVVKTRLQSDMYRQSNVSRSSAAGGRNIVYAVGQHARRLAYTFVETGMLLRRISSQEGPKALFRGIGPTLVGVIPARSINFFTYGNGKVLIAEHFNGGIESSTVHLVSAAGAGIVTATATNPIWVVKTRMQLLQHRKSRPALAQQLTRSQAIGKAQFSTSVPQSARSTLFSFSSPSSTFFRSRPRPLQPGISSVQMTLHILQTEGFAGLYKGLSASYLGATEGTIQWVLYEQFKGFERQRKRVERAGNGSAPTTSSWSATIGSAGTAKVIASLLTYPHEVLRTRLRQEAQPGQKRRYVGLLQTASLILREEGIASFYGGLSAHLLRVVPVSVIDIVVLYCVLTTLPISPLQNAAIMFLVYETMLSRYRTA